MLEVKVVYTALGKDSLHRPDYTQAAVAIGNPPSRYTLIPRIVSPLRWQDYAHRGRVAARSGIELSHAILPQWFNRGAELGTNVLGIFGVYEEARLNLTPAIFTAIGNGEGALVALSRTENRGACIEMCVQMDEELNRRWGEVIRGAALRRGVPAQPDGMHMGRSMQRLVQTQMDADEIGEEHGILYAGSATQGSVGRALVASG